MSNLNDAVDLIHQANLIAIAAHVSPDPDAIGSLLGLGLALESSGKTTILLCNDSFPQGLSFLPGSDRIQQSLPATPTPDLLIAVDSSDVNRLGEIVKPLFEAGIPVLNIDHHITNDDYGTVNIVLDRSSTAEIIIPILDALSISLTPDIATCLTAGLVADTRSFATSNVTSDTFEAARILTDAGADIAHITETVFNRKLYNELRLWGLGLEQARLRKGVIWSAMSLDERKKRGIQDTNSKGFSSILLYAEEAVISASFIEQPDNQIDVSMRASPGYNVADIAVSLGGGGHPAAAGCTMTGSLDDVVKKVVLLLKKEATRKPHEKT